jgi:hypothetical protein
MNRWITALAVVAVMAVGVVGGAPDAQASKPFTPLVKMKCAVCHTTPKGSDKDLTEAGKASQEYLKKQNYKKGEWEKIKGFAWTK